MKTTFRPHGTIIEIIHEDKTYYGFLEVDFDRFKTFGNTDIDIESLILFDKDFNQIPFDIDNYDLYMELIDLVDRKVICDESDDDDDDDDE